MMAGRARGGRNSGRMRSVSGVGRIAAIGAVIAAVVLVALVLFGGTGGYTVKAKFINAGQLVKGNPVQTGGTPIGTVKKIQITPDGQAEITLEVEKDYVPIRRGTRAAIRQFSQSGIANRYVDLTFPSNSLAGGEIADGGTIGTDDTETQVDLDQLFNTLDPVTRVALQKFFKGSAEMFKGQGDAAAVGYQYLNPALGTSRRLFGELTRDTPVLERFLVDSSKLVGALAERRDDLAGLIGNLNDTTRALGNQKAALADSVSQLPPFMRRANTTFVNLRNTLDVVDPLVDASEPVAKRLGPFLEDARAFAKDAEPTVRDLRVTIRRKGRSNDLIELMKSIPPLKRTALDTAPRSVAPGGRKVGVGRKRGAFPEIIEALKKGTPEIALARPYATDFIGWFDDFSTTGAGFDALGALARGQIKFTEHLGGGPVKSGQFKRCPGSAEEAAPDGSNVLSAAEQERLQCEERDRATGDVGG